MDIAELGIRVNSKDAKNAKTDLDGLSGAAGKAEGATNKLAAAAKRMGLALVAAFSVRAVANFFSSTIREANKFDVTMRRVEAVIRATGGAAQRTAEQLRGQAEGLARATLASTEGILEAQQTLLTFRKISGETFDRTIAAALDMSEALGTDLRSSTLQLAKALEDPITGMTALTRSGTVFTEQQKDMVKAMVESGRTAEAQTFILSELEAQYGGTAKAAAEGLAGAQDTLNQAWQEFKLAVADSFGLVEGATRLNQGLTAVVEKLTSMTDNAVGTLKTMGVILLGLAATQIPAAVAGIAALTGGMSLAAIAAGTLAGAIGVLRGALALLGGPFGLAIGAATAVGAAFFFAGAEANAARDNADPLYDLIEQGNPKLDDARTAAINAGAGFIILGDDASKGATGVREMASALDEWREAAEKAGVSMSGFGPEAMIPGARGDANIEDLENYLRPRPIQGPPAPPGGSSGGGSSGGGSSGGGASGGDELQRRIERLRATIETERGLVTEWYQEQQDLLNDKRVQEMLGEEQHKELMLELERQYQQRLSDIRIEQQSRQLSETAGLFGALQGIAETGGRKMAKAAATFGAVEATVNAYGAAVKALNTPGIGLAGRFAAYASVLATGLKGVAAIKAAGSSVGASGPSTAATAAAPQETPQTVLIQGLNRDDLFSGQQIFDLLYQENNNRGRVFQVI